MSLRPGAGNLARIVLLALVYAVAARGGLALAYESSSVTAVWGPAGIALAALVLGGRARARRIAAHDELEVQIQERTAALARSQDGLVEAQELAQIGSWEWDVQADTVTWSPMLHRIYGVQAGVHEATFGGYLERVHPGDRERVAETIRGALAAGCSFHFDERIVRPDGEIRVLASRGQVFSDAAGAVARMVGICQDVTESRRAERHLATEHAVSRVLVESPTLDEARRRLLPAFAGGLGWAVGAWWSVDHGRSILRCEQFWSDGSVDATAFEQATMQLRCAPGAGLAGRAWTDREVRVVATLEADVDLPRRQAAAQAGLTAAIAVPLVSRGEVVAVLEFRATGGLHPGDELGGMMQRLGERVARFLERTDADYHLREAEERFRRAFEDAGTGMALIGVGGEEEGRFLEVNDALCASTRYRRDELLGLRAQTIAHPEDVAETLDLVRRLTDGELDSVQAETRLLDATGEVVWMAFSTSVIRDGDGRPLYRLAQMQDVTERKRFEGQLQHLADHDPVTALFNRRRFDEELTRELAAARRYGTGGAVLALDLDNFKYVNDTLGHGAGDELIACVAEILTARLRRTDVVARLGGDEFAVVLPHVDEGEALRVASELLEAIRSDAVVTTPRGSRRTTASIGIALFPECDDRAGEELLIEADIAMYDAKEAGRDQACVFDACSSRQESLEARMTWSEQIRDALHENRFTLYAQPIVPLQGPAGDRYELLVRMVDRDGDVIPPGAFLPVAERFDLVQEIDRWVVREAIALLAEHERRGHDVIFEVNLSAKSLGEPALVADIAELVEASIADPRRLVFEVTETAAIINVDRAKQFARRLGELGCGFALDDFGAGFASFYYLKHLPFDYLKIDGEFVENLCESKTNQLVVQSVVAIARGLGKRTIAEYVDDEATLELLRAYGVDHAQGFHLGRPVPAAEIPVPRAVR